MPVIEGVLEHDYVKGYMEHYYIKNKRNRPEDTMAEASNYTVAKLHQHF